MTVLEAVERSKTPVFTYKGSIDTAQLHLTPKEVVLWAMTSRVLLDADTNQDAKNKIPGVIVLTSQRFLFVSHSSTSDTIREISVPDIHAVEPKIKLFSASLRITGASECLFIEDNSKRITALKSVLDTAIAAKTSERQIGICPYCEAHLDSDVSKCPSCGAQIPAECRPKPAVQPTPAKAQNTIFCPGCGTQTSANFCPNCGKNLQGVRTGAASAPPPPPQYIPPAPQRINVVLRPGFNCCPRCMGTNISAVKRGFSWGAGILGFLFLPPFGLFFGLIGSKKMNCSCHICKYNWEYK